MKRCLQLATAISCLLGLSGANHAQTCTMYNSTFTGAAAYWDDTTGHSTDDHNFYVQPQGTCTYSGGSSQACVVSCAAYMLQQQVTESGSLTNPLYNHYTGSTPISGGAGGNAGSSVTCGTGAGAAVQACLFVTGCTVTVGVSGSGAGLGISFSFPPSTVWTKPYTWTNSCAARTAPPCAATYPAPISENPNYTYIWSTTYCEWIRTLVTQGPTPIIINTDGVGFDLTSRAAGVKFDFYGNGHPIQISWTAAGSSNGWLALDRNHNGKIDSAMELFGNVTPQPTDKGPLNGFLALSVYDSNMDGVIDAQDYIWPKLLVWIDANHDGVSQPNELHHLDKFGITSISLKYQEEDMKDQYGNKFRYKGHLGAANDDPVERVIYDVFLLTN